MILTRLNLRIGSFKPEEIRWSCSVRYWDTDLVTQSRSNYIFECSKILKWKWFKFNLHDIHCRRACSIVKELHHPNIDCSNFFNHFSLKFNAVYSFTIAAKSANSPSWPLYNMFLPRHLHSTCEHFQLLYFSNLVCAGCEGRAGMAAIVLRRDHQLNGTKLYNHLLKTLPAYAWPQFLRIQVSQATSPHLLH